MAELPAGATEQAFFANRYPGLVSVAISFGILMLTLLILPVRYETTDDLWIVIQLADTADGFFPPFLGYCLNWALASLYRWAPDFPWFGALLYLAAASGGSLILSAGLSQRAPVLSQVALVAGVSVLLFQCYSAISYTMSSLLLQFGVCATLLSGILGRRSAPFKSGQLVIYALALIVSWQLRWRLASVSLLFGLPVLVVARREHWKPILVLLLVLGSIGVGDRLLTARFAPSEVKAFDRFNLVRAAFHDTDAGEYHGEATQKILAQVKWTRLDYYLAQSWLHFDRTRFNTQTFETFVRLNAKVIERRAWPVWYGNLERNASDLADRSTALLALFAVLLLLRLRGGPPLGLRALIGGGLVLTQVVLFLGLRPVPLRVALPLLAYLYTSLALICRDIGEGVPSGPTAEAWQRACMVGAVVAMLAGGGLVLRLAYEQVGWLQESYQRRLLMQRALTQLRRQRPSPLIIVALPRLGHSIGAELMHPLRERRSFKGLQIFPWVMGINSPRYFGKLRRLGASSGLALLRRSINNDNVVYIYSWKGKLQSRNMLSGWHMLLSRRVMPGVQVRLHPTKIIRNAYGGVAILHARK